VPAAKSGVKSAGNGSAYCAYHRALVYEPASLAGRDNDAGLGRLP
jgi:hypothetical protein